MREDNIVFLPERYEEYVSLEDVKNIVIPAFTAAASLRLDLSPITERVNSRHVTKTTCRVPLRIYGTDATIDNVMTEIKSFYSHNSDYEMSGDIYKYTKVEFGNYQLALSFEFELDGDYALVTILSGTAEGVSEVVVDNEPEDLEDPEDP